MADEKDAKRVPVERWIPDVKSDSADYLERSEPVYGPPEDGAPEEIAEYERAERDAQRIIAEREVSSS